MKLIMNGRVTGINGDGSPSIEITHARVNDLKHPWKLGEQVFLEVDLTLTDILPPCELKESKANTPSPQVVS